MEAEAALRILQSLEPAGVGARNVQECLLLQIGRDPDADGSAQRIVRDCFSDLERGRLPRISAQLGMTPEELKKSLRYIRALNPRPGLAYGSGAAPYVQPDAVIVRKQDGYHVVINEANCPKLSLSEYYRNMLGSDEYISAYGYLRTNLDSAEWLLRSLGKRKKTLQKVIRSGQDPI
ncbi:hypothetical protein [Paenibacillus apii]|uniref:RNA polymerase factor sigma-54 n=1 Tax=Paenibacillus apii TaxID=1850370 RepID=UPI002E28B462|nr:hypothetical protein [Paenibacillus apii]